jgi:integrase
VILPDVTAHLADHVPTGPGVIVFTTPGGKLLRHPNFRRNIWLPALSETGLPGTHFHDLRHAGNQLVANAGANLRELMERMGHSTSRAALVYLHSTNERQRELAEAVAARARTELGLSTSRGTYVARPAHEAD